MQVGSVVCLCREVYSPIISPALAPGKTLSLVNASTRPNPASASVNWREVSDTRRQLKESFHQRP